MEPHAITDLQIRNILVPTDFSACSQKALLFAAKIARRHKSKLTLLHIVPPQFGLIQHQQKNQALRAAWSELKQLQADLLSKGVLGDIHHELLVRRGKSWSVISRILERQSTDLIVIGTHGRTGLKKRILGSFAESVFRQAPCPVVTIGPRTSDQAGNEYPQHILFPTDGSYVSKGAEPYAFQLARAPGTEVTLLGVVHTDLFEHGKSPDDDERLKHAKERLQATALYGAWREGGAPPNVVAEIGSKVKTILRVAASTAADLIVLGISGDVEEPQMFGWADAYQVVCSALCPVLTVRQTFPGPYFKRLLQMKPVALRAEFP